MPEGRARAGRERGAGLASGCDLGASPSLPHPHGATRLLWDRGCGMLLGWGPAEPKRLGADSGDCLGPPRRCSRGVWPTPVSLGGEILKCSAAARRGKAWGQATSCPHCGHSCYNSGVWLPGSCCAFGEPGPCQQRCRRMPPKGKGKGKRVKQQKRRSAAGEFGVLPALRQQGCDPRIPAMLRRRRRRQQGPQGPAAPPGPGWGASKCQAPASTDL